VGTRVLKGGAGAEGRHGAARKGDGRGGSESGCFTDELFVVGRLAVGIHAQALERQSRRALRHCCTAAHQKRERHPHQESAGERWNELVQKKAVK